MKIKSIHSKLIFLPISLAYILHGAKTPLTFYPIFILTGLIFFFLNKQNRPPRLIPQEYLLPLGLYFLWSVLPLLGGVAIDIHLFNYSRNVVYFLAGILLFQYSDSQDWDLFEKLLILLGTVESVFIVRGQLIGQLPHLSGYLHNSLHSGILLPISFSMGLSKFKNSSRSWIMRGGFAFITLLILTSIILIQSRSAFIVAIIILIASFPRSSIRLILTTSAIALGLLLYKKDAMISFFKFNSLGYNYTQGRISIWLSALDAIRNRPLLGYGLGNFETAYLQFQHPSEEALRFGRTTMFAHNGFLQVASETGIPSLIFIGWFFLNVIKTSFKQINENLTLYSVILTFFITSLFNYSVYLPFNGLILFMTLGQLAIKSGLVPPSENQNPIDSSGLISGKKGIFIKNISIVPYFLIAILSVVLTSTFIAEIANSKNFNDFACQLCPFRSDLWYQKGLENIRQNKNPIPYLKKALLWNSQNPFYWQRLALVYAQFGPNEKNLTNEYFKEAQQRAPNHAPFYIQDAFFNLSINEDLMAEKLLKKAANLEPQAAVPHYGLGLIYLKAKNIVKTQTEIDEARRLKNLYLQTKNSTFPKNFDQAITYSNYDRVLFEFDESQLKGGVGPR